MWRCACVALIRPVGSAGSGTEAGRGEEGPARPV